MTSLIRSMTLAAGVVCAVPALAQDDARAAAESYVNSPVQQQLISDLLSEEAVINQLRAMLPPDTPAEMIEEVSVIVADELNGTRDAMSAAMVTAAMQIYTVEELQALDTFSRSEVGSSALLKALPFQQAFVETIDPVLREMQTNIITRLQTLEN
ncbi:MAG: hypothetical protein AAGK98_12230 [Pseudomonadota bacterium]